MQITQEIQVSLQDERDMEEIQQTVLEREKLIEIIQKKYSVIQYYMANSCFTFHFSIRCKFSTSH